MSAASLRIDTAIAKAFPDPSEDLFWQKATSARDEDPQNFDAIWSPQSNKTPALPPPPPPPPPATTNAFNQAARHSRKSSHVSWGLLTDSEKHVELLETKLKDVQARHNETTTDSTATLGSVRDPDDDMLSSLGYYPPHSSEATTADADTSIDSQETDEGLWLLWQTPYAGRRRPSEEGDVPQSLYLPMLSSTQSSDREALQGQEDDTEDGAAVFADDEEHEREQFLLERARRKAEDEYLRGVNVGFNALWRRQWKAIATWSCWWCSCGVRDDDY